MALSATQISTIRAELDPSGYVAGAKQVVTANEQIGASSSTTAGKVTRDQEAIKRTLVDNGSAYERLKRQADPAYDAMQRIAKAQETATRAVALGRATQEEATAVVEKYQAQLTRTGAGHEAMGKSAGQASVAIRSLGIQSIDVFSQLSSGAPIMTTFIQQGSQVVQVAATSGTSLAVFGNLARTALTSVISPLGLVISGFAALAGIGVAVVARSMSITNETRDMQTSIAAVGRTAEISASQIQSYVTALSNRGMSRADATGIIGTLARNPALSGAAIGRAASMVPDAAVSLATTPEEAAKQIGAAAGGSLEAIKRLDDAINFLSRDERAAIQTAFDHGRAIEGTDRALAALGRRIDGARDNSLGPYERAWEKVTGAVSKSLDVLDKYGAAKIFTSPAPVMTSLIDAATKLTERGPAAPTARQAEESSTGAYTRDLERQGKVIDEVNKKYEEQNRILRAGLPDRARVQAEIEAGNEAANRQITDLARRREFIANAGMAAARMAADPGNLEMQSIQRQTEGHVRLTSALVAEGAALSDRVQGGIVAQAQMEAHEKAATTAGISEEAYARAIKNRAAAQAAAAGANTAKDLEYQSAAMQRLSGAMTYGEVAAAELTNKIEIATRSLREMQGAARRVDVLESLMKAEDAVTKEVTKLEADTRLWRERKDLIASNDNISILEKEISLIGESEQARGREIERFKELRRLMRESAADPNNLTSSQRELIEAAGRRADLTMQFEREKRGVEEMGGAVSNAVDQVGNSITTALVSGQSAAINFRNIMTAVAGQILQSFLKLAVINPIINNLFGTNRPMVGIGDFFSGVGGGGDGIASWLDRTFGGGGVAAVAGQSAFSGNGYQMFHSGGLVGVDMAPMRQADASAFVGAPRYHAGLASDEFAAILQRGERVLTERDDRRVRSTMDGLSVRAAGPTNIVVNIQTPDADSFRASRAQVTTAIQGAALHALRRSGARA